MKTEEKKISWEKIKVTRSYCLSKSWSREYEKYGSCHVLTKLLQEQGRDVANTLLKIEAKFIPSGLC